MPGIDIGTLINSPQTAFYVKKGAVAFGAPAVIGDIMGSSKLIGDDSNGMQDKSNAIKKVSAASGFGTTCLLYTSPSPRDS